MRFEINKSVVPLIVIVLLSFAHPLVASNVSFTRVADTSTALPGGAGNFAGFLPPALEQGDIAFLGFDSSWHQGIYTRIGGTWGVVADATSIAPGTSEYFTSMGSPSLDGGNVAFAAKGAPYQTEGIYTTLGGGLNKVVDNHDIPPAGGTFVSFRDPTLDGQSIGFKALGQIAYQAVYTRIDGALNLIADTNTVMPGHTGTFAAFPDGQSVPVSGAATAFHGRENTAIGVGQSGIYATIGGSLITVVDVDSTVPGDPIATFWGFSSPVMSGDQLAFTATYQVGGAWQSAILTWSDGTLDVLYDNDTLMPGRTETFAGFHSLSLDAGTMAFEAPVPGSYYDGLYTNVGGTLTKIIEPGDTLDGKTVDYIDIGPEALSGNQIAFTATFTDGSYGIYIATVPEPATMVLLMTAVLGLLTRGTPKRRL